MERTTVGSVLRTTQAWCLHLGDKETLELGIAYYSDRFPDLPDTNQFREVIATDPDQVAAAFDEASRWFQEKSLECQRWAPAVGDASPALEQRLLDCGFQKHTHIAFRLAKWPELQHCDELRILPARAMRDAFHELIVANSKRHTQAIRISEAQAWNERLDEPQLDLFIATDQSTPVGYAGLFQVGDIARVVLPVITREHSRTNVADTLLDHMLTLAKRLTLATVVTTLDADDETGRVWLENAGFVADGTIVEFDRTTGAADQ
jgi:Acetyltransferase (GNAT) domain